MGYFLSNHHIYKYNKKKYFKKEEAINVLVPMLHTLKYV